MFLELLKEQACDRQTFSWDTLWKSDSFQKEFLGGNDVVKVQFQMYTYNFKYYKTPTLVIFEDSFGFYWFKIGDSYIQSQQSLRQSSILLLQ